MATQIVAFTLAATVVTITPGADMALVARRVAWAWMVGRAGLIVRPRARALVERLTGGVPVALSLRLATTSR